MSFGTGRAQKVFWIKAKRGDRKSCSILLINSLLNPIITAVKEATAVLC
jgi:hypothetical protein